MRGENRDYSLVEAGGRRQVFEKYKCCLFAVCHLTDEQPVRVDNQRVEFKFHANALAD